MAVNLEAFFSGLGRRAFGSAGALAPAMEDAVRRAEAAWPTLTVPPDAFLRRLGHCLRDEEPEDVAALASLELGDLYLATACLLGFPAALEELEKSHLSFVPAFISQIDRSPETADEICQAVRGKLLLGENGREPKLAQYLGHGPLHSWVAVVAQRTALDALRRENRAPRVEENALEVVLSTSSDSELALVKARLRSHFEEALRSALQHLSVRERTALRLTLIAGLSLERVAAMYRVNPSTVSRWLGKARETLLAQMRGYLEDRGRLDPADLESMVRLVRSQVDVNLSLLLGDAPAPLS